MAPDSTSQTRHTNISKRTIESNHPVLDPVAVPLGVAEPRLTDTTLAIVQYVIYSLVGRNIEVTPSPVAKKVRDLTREILAKHDVYNSLCSNLDFTPANLEQNFHGVAENIFEDGFINWGRLIALLGFSEKVAEYLRLNGFGNHDDRVIDLTTRFIVRKTGFWIQSRGGWENVIAHFDNSKQLSPQNTWFRGILVTATATIGLGALIAVCK